MKSKFIISTDGAKIAYNVYGAGYPLILVHGMGENKELWVNTNWVEKLKDYFTVITIDIRGYGESDKSYDPNFYSINNILSDIDVITQECGFDEYNYLGHSYGATIGLQLCKHNRNINRLVCGGTTFGDKFFKEIVPEWISKYENYDSIKKNNTSSNNLELSKEDLEWIKKTDFELAIAQFKAWNHWKGVDVKDINTNLAMYSGTNDNPHVLENFEANKTQLYNKNIIFKVFKDLNHTELVSKVDIVYPWVLDFLLR